MRFAAPTASRFPPLRQSRREAARNRQRTRPLDRGRGIESKKEIDSYGEVETRTNDEKIVCGKRRGREEEEMEETDGWVHEEMVETWLYFTFILMG